MDSILVVCYNPKCSKEQKETKQIKKTKRVNKQRGKKNKAEESTKKKDLFRTLNINDPVSFVLNVENAQVRGFGEADS